jgi:hypothetical protein
VLDDWTHIIIFMFFKACALVYCCRAAGSESLEPFFMLLSELFCFICNHLHLHPQDEERVRGFIFFILFLFYRFKCWHLVSARIGHHQANIYKNLKMLVVPIISLVNIMGSHSHSLLFFLTDTSYSCVSVVTIVYGMHQYF